ncbi:unnamed protein product, partial [Prorocentrum cordatum]
AGATIDVNDLVKCQPVMATNRRALSITEAEGDARSRREGIDRKAALAPEDRKRLDKNVAQHYSFQWPQTMLVDDATMGRLMKMFTKKTHVKPLGGLIQLVRWHMLLMAGYARAAGPDRGKISLATLLHCRDWVMKKACDGDCAREKIKRLIDADFEMRANWTLGNSAEEHPTLAAAIQHHGHESAYLFQDVSKTTNTHGHYERSEDNNQSRASSAKGYQNNQPCQSRGRSRSQRAETGDKPFMPQKKTPSGAEICAFYNK